MSIIPIPAKFGTTRKSGRSHHALPISPVFLYFPILRQLDPYNNGMDHEWAFSKELRQQKLDSMPLAQQGEYLAQLKQAKQRYDAVYAEFHKRFVVECEELPEEWTRKDMWGEVKPDVQYNGCWFMNPYHIRRIKSLNK
jgi:hypothetical protein